MSDNSCCLVCKTKMGTMQWSRPTGKNKDYAWCEVCKLAFDVKKDVQLTREDGMEVKPIIGLD